MILVADNLQAVNPRVAAALENLDPGPLQEIARRAERAGAHMLDLNPGYLSKRKEDRMAFMVEAVQEVSDLRLVLDSPRPGVLARGLAACDRVPILNALSLEPEKIDAILPLAAEYQADLVILLMDDKSMTPARVEDKLSLALELADHCRAAGLEMDKLIFDPVLPSLTWPDAYLRMAECLRSVRMLAGGDIFGESVRTMIGLSNLRSGQRNIHPVAVETTCLAMMAGAGLHFALANALDPAVSETISFIRRMEEA